MLQYPNGKLPEFVNALTDQPEDDGLNINDDTPLYVMAANHYYRATGDLDWLRQIYPSLAKAGRHIVSQMDPRDLVYCSANDPRGYVWAIAGWRNVIPNYSINGAVTEINSECVAALRYLAYLAERIPGSDTDARYFMDYSNRIRHAMAKHLINPDNRMFYLNIGVEGEAHTDLTGDEVFPVMFQACDEETAYRIISRLNSPDFWTSAGLRTASNLDPRYDPAAFSGLIGGVWPGLTWWYAFAAAPFHPEFMVKALRSSFEHYAKNPRRYNTVPGQFSEWFDGESLVNRGMRLSPWEPPRFLWAAIEGVCGLTLTGDLPQIQPLIPAAWRWLALRRVPYHGEEISYFAVRTRNAFHLYTTCEIDTNHRHSVYKTDASDNIPIFSRSARVIAFAREHETILLVGNVTTTSINVPLDLSSILMADTKYRLSIYNSESDAWETETVIAREEVVSVTATIESQGYRLMHFTSADK
jgi:glycogen debranching enzyme